MATSSSHAQVETLQRLTQTVTARLMGVTTKTLRAWDCPRNPDGSYNGPALVAWRIETLLAAERSKLADGDLAGPDSPSMERLRRLRGDLAELDLAERRRQVVPSDLAVRALATVATRLRRAGETLVKRHGPGAADALEQALDDAERDLKQEWGPADA